jgi:seryl-tRNA synthetase
VRFPQTPKKLKKPSNAEGNKVAIEALKGIVSLDVSRRQALQSVEALKAKRNQASLQIGALKKNKQDDPALMEEMKKVSQEIKDQDAAVAEIEAKIHSLTHGDSQSS